MAKNDLKELVTRGMLNEAVDALLKGMDNLFFRFKTELKTELDPIKSDVSTLKEDVYFIKQDVRDIKADLSDTPTRREFNNLKQQVETLQ